MTTVRGYGFGHATPRHKVNKRTYRDCIGCGKRTWSPRGICSTCSGRAEYRREVVMYGHTRAEASRQRAREIYRLLRDTDLPQVEIAAMFDVSDDTVNAIRGGYTHKAITGGYVLRPKERGEK